MDFKFIDELTSVEGEPHISIVFSLTYCIYMAALKLEDYKELNMELITWWWMGSIRL